MIESAQAAPDAGPKMSPKTWCQPSRTALIRKYSGFMMKPPRSLEELDHSDSSSQLGMSSERGGTGSYPPGVQGWQRSTRRTRQPAPLDAAMHGDRLESVGRAGRVVATHLAVHRADHETICAQEADQQELHRDSPACAARSADELISTPHASRHRSSSRASSSYDAAAAPGQGADHHHALSGQQGSALAGQVAQSALHQVAGDGSTDGLGHHEAHSRCDEGTQIGALGRRDQQVDHDQWAAAAPATAHDLSEVNGRGQAVAGGEHARLLTPQAARRLRPLRRRDDRIERPARVRIRRRKPWVLCRRRLFGWNVRLLNVIHSTRGAGLKGPITGSSRRVGRQLWSTGTAAHTTLWTDVMDMRHRSTPVSTCQRYALAVHRVNSASAPEPPSPPARPP